MFKSVLIANRGEISVRIQRTLRRLGIESIAVFSDADVDAPHVRIADRAVRIGPASVAKSYLDVQAILAAAQHAGAEAVHPGYGFLSERADFAEACMEAGLIFVGPSPEAIALLGDKAAAKRAAAAAGVPVVPGLSPDAADGLAADGARLEDDQILTWAADQQLPLLLKASGGGGGRGMRVVTQIEDLPSALQAARREAYSAFGDERLIVERFIARARHIEVQVIADSYGNVLHLGERECSLQRRHQKVIEESPSPVVGAKLRERMGAAAVALARSCGYTGAGTVELIADRDDPESFFFLEMNARLQVEHPVTEAVTGLDLVELQLRAAAGEPLGLTQRDVRIEGHAIEARIYAEDPAHDFMPSTGRIAIYREPQTVRFDSGVAEGTEVGAHYDPMLAKAIAYADDREAALQRLQTGLRQTRILGPGTNLAWLLTLLARDEVRMGRIDTTLLERLGHQIDSEVTDQALLAGIALVAMLASQRARLADDSGEPLRSAACGDSSRHAIPGDPWHALDGWRLDGRGEAWMQLLTSAGEADARATADGQGRWRVGEAKVWELPSGLGIETADGVLRTVEVHRDGEAVWLVQDGVPLRFAPAQREARRHAGAGSLQAPMPGVVLEVCVPVGAPVQEGEVLVVLESMKMELSVASPEQGVVGAVHVATGDRVTQGQALLELEAASSG